MLRQNVAELKISMEIDLQNSPTDQAGESVSLPLLFLKVRCAGQCPFDILHLPHSGRVLQQLLLLITETSDIVKWSYENKVDLLGYTNTAAFMQQVSRLGK